MNKLTEREGRMLCVLNAMHGRLKEVDEYTDGDGTAVDYCLSPLADEARGILRLLDYETEAEDDFAEEVEEDFENDFDDEPPF